MNIVDAQREMRTRFVGGFYGQLVSGALWLVSAGLAAWRGPRASILMLVIGGMFIFPITELLLRSAGERVKLSPGNALHGLGSQVAFVLPASMPVLLGVGLYRLNWFFPAMMILVGAHYLPFAFLYGMRMFTALAITLVAGGVAFARFLPGSFSASAWFTAVVLLVFAIIGRVMADAEYRKAERGTRVRLPMAAGA